ncbi:NTP transferase domain-containing protein [bacterium]|nr:NTP transferase domain-containing protein [bacterium]
MKDIAAIILAAGESSRMGQPKAFLEYQGKTFLDTITDKFRQAGCDPVIVVVPVGFALNSEELAARKLLYRYNESPENGQFSSLILGASLAPPSCGAAFFCPVDHPAFQSATLE